jgi:hypothetical protein
VLVRLAALGFGLIQALLLLRLVLPFVPVPKAAHQYVPLLVSVTDVLVAPFQIFIKSFPLNQVATTLPGGGFGAFSGRVDPGVIAAMVGWAAIAIIVSVMLTLAVRIRA